MTNRPTLATFLLLLFPIISWGQNYFKASEKLPSDVAMALDFLQVHSSPEINRAAQFKELDLLLQQLSEEERLMILKSEFYKAILKMARGVPVQRSSYRRETLDRLKKSFEERDPNQWSELSAFFIQALIRDIELIMKDPNYPNFLNQLSSGRVTSQSRSFKQKLDNLLPWVQWYFEGSLPGLEQKLLNTSELALGLIIERVKNLVFMTEFEAPKKTDQDAQLSFFESTPHPKASKEEEKSAEELVEGIDIDFSTPSQDSLDEKWVPRVAPDPNYQAPETLPEPVDDWLPKPVDDWLDDM